MFKNRVVRRIFGHKREEVAGGWRTPHNVELHNLPASPYIIRMIKLKRMRWTEQVARTGRTEMHTTFWLENLKEKDYLKYLCTYGKIKLESILGK
jgi:hypothetical protein